MRKGAKITILAVLVLALGGTALMWRTASRDSLPSQAYVWQRKWGDEVRAAVRRAAPSLEGLVVLAAEVDIEGGKGKAARVAIDHAALAACGRPVGLALRINPYPGPFDRDGGLARSLGDLAAELVAGWRGKGLEPSELQVDFDCAASKLDGYRAWIEAIRPRVAPVPFAITALPSWLERPAFRTLAAEAGGFVLQVHSIERPSGPNRPIVICDPAAARRSVAKAGRLGIPFRAALPTYGYLVAFGPGGDFLGISAEGPRPSWPRGAVVREARADPAAMAGLVRALTAERPAMLAGLIWYRLPVDTDSLNWRWPTFAAVIRGRDPPARSAEGEPARSAKKPVRPKGK